MARDTVGQSEECLPLVQAAERRQGSELQRTPSRSRRSWWQWQTLPLFATPHTRRWFRLSDFQDSRCEFIFRGNELLAYCHSHSSRGSQHACCSASVVGLNYLKENLPNRLCQLPIPSSTSNLVHECQNHSVVQTSLGLCTVSK